ncbi:hypothetical protein [Chondromyces apiculatus]|uniref:Uncharacterized protein n=1 Tax=Chondromyces apiculatus DSM 436 TaxID=1192034 RepID=A0A017SZ60_9BACT|nr:hypothetical protein [Chondromyces apiculatus]EYF01905.1 Hypothetical protein CAP_7673 [Chondromyces apiculatus DSM 436]
MPFALFPAAPPQDGAIMCRDGYWWHWHPVRRECFAGTSSLSVHQLEACFVGTPLERGRFLAELTEGQFSGLFVAQCTQCGADHRKQPRNLARAFRQIQPAARGASKSLGSVDLFAVAAVRGANDRETERLQILDASARHLTRGKRVKRAEKGESS